MTGFLLGVTGPIAEKWDHPIGVILGLIFHGGWPWACYAFMVGFFRRSRTESAILSSLGLACAVVAYYLSKSISPTLPAGLETSASTQVSYSGVLFWGIAAFTLGALVGLLGNMARSSGAAGLTFRLMIPATALLETWMRLTHETDGEKSIVVNTWIATLIAATVAALAILGHAIFFRRKARRAHSMEPRNY
ncbi:hypothetical protein [Streptomyces sp. NPDC001568]|uniref:hypothetical protein n=1 Tax=Streptomyces sp. NPDC001568 TaxID=3364588 RepID=UPI00367AFBAC